MAQVFLAYAQEPAQGIQPVSPVRAIRQFLANNGIILWPEGDYGPSPLALEASISRAVEACDNYVILISPQAMEHTFCLQGLLFALSMNKRVVPVMVETTALEHLPEPLQTLDWVDLRPVSVSLAQGQGKGGRHLLRILRHEAAYHHTHKQLLASALSWERQGRSPEQLMGEDDLTSYLPWLTAALQRPSYGPIQLQTLFVVASLEHWGQWPEAKAGWPQRAYSLAKTKIW